MQTEVIKRETTRRIPIQKDWFDYHLDAIVYSFMVSSATSRMKPGDKKDGSQSYLYLSQSKYRKIRPVIKNVIGKTARQIKERVDKLISAGYIKYDQANKQYTFPFDYNEKYYIVSTDVLTYLCTVSNPFVIKIYFYLADRYKYKSDYLFTLTELRKMLGYSGSANANANNLIKLALSSLSVMEFIKYQPVQVKGVGNTDRPVDEFKLVYVTGKNLPKKIELELTQNLAIEKKQIIQLISG